AMRRVFPPPRNVSSAARPDNRRVSWIAQAVLGVVWTVCGVVIGLSPPLSDSGKGAASPFVGWLVVAYGIFLIINGFRRAADPPTGAPGLARGGEAARRSELLFPLLAAAIFAMGAGVAVWGVVSGRAALACVGIVSASIGVMTAPHALAALRSRL